LRAFARAEPSGTWSRVDLRERVERTLALLRHRLHGGVTVIRDYGALPPVECAPGQLDQVLLNIIANALDALGGRGTITIGMHAEDDPVPAARPGPHVVLRVHDDGPGMTAEVRRRVFDPFFTTKPEGRGTGLGLSVSYGIVERHGGTIFVESALGQGTAFTVYLPLTQPARQGGGPTA